MGKSNVLIEKFENLADLFYDKNLEQIEISINNDEALSIRFLEAMRKEKKTFSSRKFLLIKINDIPTKRYELSYW